MHRSAALCASFEIRRHHSRVILLVALWLVEVWVLVPALELGLGLAWELVQVLEWGERWALESELEQVKVLA
jgi:hypothetical protein